MKKFFIEYDTNQFSDSLDKAITTAYQNFEGLSVNEIGKAIAFIYKELPSRSSNKYDRSDFIFDLERLTFIGYDRIEAEDNEYLLIFWEKTCEDIVIYPCTL